MTQTAQVRFRVYGEPRPQGSKKSFAVYRGRGADREFTGKVTQVESSDLNLKTWRQQCAIAVREARPSGGPIEGPVALTVTFYLAPPRKPRWPLPAKYPDLSKLVRALEDELSGVAIGDDRQITAIDARKVWASEHAPPGARVVVEAIA